ncbi:hypothetical protein VNI00_008651 [Paramarasmius palmivorus]|uniref:Protein kinase domain-containing protein n=1 Tax=Paramarasmius palmivorus TaxID=297713 RepID=A0AAW0CXI8_9AGAR
MSLSSRVSSWISAFAKSSTSSSSTSSPSIPPEEELPNVGTLRIDAHKLPQDDASISSFVFLVAGLEKQLSIRDDAPILIDTTGATFTNRVHIGYGASFLVERAEWSGKNAAALSRTQERWGKFVALKYARRTTKTKDSFHWKHILLEIRALLHEPIRYHPNIVRLLGLSWGAAKGHRSNFPMLVLEFSELGNFAQLQETENLPFDVKKKLCYDISKGISILHACGIVHGDLKHDNVLIFPNHDPKAEIAYVAKLADFGGSVMDLDDQGNSLHMGTPPYEAPEMHEGKLSAEGMKQTDVYSLGLLVWRAMLDGNNPFSVVYEGSGEINKSEIMKLKRSSELRELAKRSLRKHTQLDQVGLDLLDYTLENTLHEDPNKRRLSHAMAALQVAQLSEVESLLKLADNANKEEELEEATLAPGHYGVSRDAIGLLAASNGLNFGYYDHQKLGPGYRPFISVPDPGEFLFEPERLRTILDWEAQQAIIHDLETAASAPPGQYPTQISNAVASFYLFKCYCHEFGVTFDAEWACHWLRQAALSREDCQESYLAKAWCWRVHQALGVVLDVEIEILRAWMTDSIVRGHIKCISEAEEIGKTLADVREQRIWEGDIERHTTYLRLFGAGIGMPYFMSHKFRREYPLHDLPALDRAIQEELSLRETSDINKIYVNDRGHGLLHYAASVCNLNAIRHLIDKYSANIDLPNQHADETPLLSLLLLDRGANPDGSDHAIDTPLYWLCAFTESEIPTIASRLVQAGAKLTNNGKHCGIRRPKNNFWVDYEGLFCLPVSPLSRAVMMDSMPAVRALLALGADPLEKVEQRSSICPIVVASVLLLPDILEVMLSYIDARTEVPTKIFDELEMLGVAMSLKTTMQDPMALLDRVTRCSAGAKLSLDRTLRILHDRDSRLRAVDEMPRQATDPNFVNTILIRLIALSRTDIIRSLFELGHRPLPSMPYPIAMVTALNNETIFRLFLEFGVEIPRTLEMENQTCFTLLDYSAARFSHSRLGIWIPEYLLKEMEVPLEPSFDSGLHSAFASAVKSQLFDLADILLKYGANIDFLYRRNYSAIRIPVFAELLSSALTEKTLESIRWLLNVDQEGQSLHGTDKSRACGHVLPAFVINDEEKYCILHFAARFLAGTRAEKQMLSRITHLILGVQHYRSQLEYSNPTYGTPLMAAVIYCNLEVIPELLEAGASLTSEVQGSTPVSYIQDVLEMHPDLPLYLKRLYGDDNATQQLVWKRIRSIAEMFDSHGIDSSNLSNVQ